MLQADVETDEVYAQMTLQPLGPVNLLSNSCSFCTYVSSLGILALL